MKICLITHSYPAFNGDWRSNFIESLAEAYTDWGHNVMVYVPYSKGWKRLYDEGKGVRIVTYKYAPFESWHILGYGRSLKKDLYINSTHAFLGLMMIISGALQFARLLRKEKFDLVHAHWAIPNTIIALLGKYLSTTQTRIFTSFPGSDVTLIIKMRFLGKLLARFIRKSDFISCNSTDLAEELAKAGIPRDRINLVIYGVNNNAVSYDFEGRQKVRKLLKIADDEILLLMAGRFVPKKGFSTGLRAMKQIVDKNTNVKMAVIGSGSLFNEYCNILEQEKAKANVLFLGEVERNKINAYYSACDIFLMPSERQPPDGLNVVVPEAMACGRPVVASRAGGNEIVVLDGENGYLHTAGNHLELAEAILRLISDPVRMKAMGERSLLLVRTRFNVKSVASQYLSEFERLLK